MKKLIIGGSGHVGAYLARVLLAENYPVRALVRRSSNIQGLAGLDVELVYGDILEPDSLARAMAGCDVVFHLAAPTNLIPEQIHIIVDGTRNVLEQADKAGISNLVYTSSIVTIGYANAAGKILDETSNQRTPASTYHLGKWQAEKLVLKFSQTSAMSVVVVNPSTIVGPLDYRITPSNFPIQRCLDRGLPFTFDSGLTVVHVEDVARGHLLAMLKGKSGQRYILGGDRIATPEYFKLICKLCQRPQPYFKIPRPVMLLMGAGFSTLQRAGYKTVPFTYEQAAQLVGKYGWYSSRKAADELGYSWRSVEEAVHSYIQWAQTRSVPPQSVRDFKA
jgi:dihydroflavonol-4-reductase